MDISYEYFGNTSSNNTCWLKLKKIKTIGGGSNNEYSFSYINESFTSSLLKKDGMSIDHWGYFNNQMNSTLIPLTNIIQQLLQQSPGFNPNIPWANRNPDFNYSKLFALQEVRYPTGGTTSLAYESAGGKGIRVSSQIDYDGINSNSKYYNYYPDILDNADYERDEYYMGGCCGLGPLGDPDLRYNIFFANQKGTLDFFGKPNEYYSKVTEYIGSPIGINGKTEYEYTSYGCQYTHKKFLTKKTDYTYGNSNFISQEKYIYNPIELRNINYWVIPKMIMTGMSVPASMCYVGVGIQSCCPMEPIIGKHYILGQFDGGIQNISAIWFQLDSLILTKDQVTSSKRFSYKAVQTQTGLPLHVNITKSEERLSIGDIKKVEYYYPRDTDPDNSYNILGIPQMWNNSINYINPIIKTRIYNNSSLVFKDENIFTYDAVNNIINRTRYDEYLNGSIESKRSWLYTFGSFGEVTNMRKENDFNTAFLWDNTRAYLMAKVENINFSTISSQNGKECTISSSTLYTYIKNLAPESLITTFSYLPLIGLESKTDNSGVTIHYQYDNFGRLQFIKNDDLKLLKKFDYNYGH